MFAEPTSAAASLRTGARVEVATRFTGSWTGGFEVIGLDPNCCRVRRLSDGAVIPGQFELADVRPAHGAKGWNR
jgi:hypothetical protein